MDDREIFAPLSGIHRRGMKSKNIGKKNVVFSGNQHFALCSYLAFECMDITIFILFLKARISHVTIARMNWITHVKAWEVWNLRQAKERNRTKCWKPKTVEWPVRSYLKFIINRPNRIRNSSTNRIALLDVQKIMYPRRGMWKSIYFLLAPTENVHRLSLYKARPCWDRT